MTEPEGGGIQRLSTWDQLPWSQRFQLVDVWTISILLANGLHSVCCILFLFPKSFENETLINLRELYLFNGLATFIIIFTFTKYVEYNHKNNLFTETISVIQSPLIKMFVSTIPIMIGISYFCIGYFGMSSWRFRRLDTSMAMLWALWNGDEIQNVYYYLAPINYFVTFLFCYTWVWFSNNMVHNAFLALLEDGYTMQN